MASRASNFDHASVTKYILLASFVVTLISRYVGVNESNYLSFNNITSFFGPWKVVSSMLVLHSTSELVVASFLIYQLRFFERLIGSSKQFVFLLFTLATSRIIQVLALNIIRDPHLILRPGMYGFLFAQLVLFYYEVPSLSSWTMHGITVSNKAFLYFWFTVLFFSNNLASIIPGLSGIAAGLLYRSNLLGIRQAKLPEHVIDSVSTLLAPFRRALFNVSQPQQQPALSREQGVQPSSVTPAPPSRPNDQTLVPNSTPTIQGSIFSPSAPRVLPAPSFQSPGPSMAASVAASPYGISPAPLDTLFATGAMPASSAARTASPLAFSAAASTEHVEELVSMGFERNKVMWALTVCSNNISAAADLLLSSN